MPNQHFAPAFIANFLRLLDRLILRRGIFAKRTHRLVEFIVELRAVIFYHGKFLRLARRDFVNLRGYLVVRISRKNFVEGLNCVKHTLAKRGDFVNRIFRRNVLALDKARNAARIKFRPVDFERV